MGKITDDNTRLNILSLEDSPHDFEILQELLSKGGYNLNITRVDKENEFSTLLRTKNFDLILADFNLPGFNAFGALKIALDINPDIPFIVVSGSIGEETAIELIRNGAVDYVLKDKPERLPFAIKRALDKVKENEAHKEAEKKLKESERILNESREALTLSEKKYRYLFENNPFPMWIYDLETLAFLEVNKAAVKHYGYSEQEFLKMTLKDIRPKEDVNRLMLDVANTFKELNSAGVWRHLKKNGEIIFVEITSHVIDYESRKARLVLSNDITKRKEAIDELRKISRAVEQNPASVVITDLAGNIEYVNSKFTALTGYSREEVLGKNPRILKSDKTSGEEYKVMWNTIASGNDWQGEFNNRKKNGDLYYELASISPITDEEGRITHFLAIKEDITEQKRSAEALKISEEKYRKIFENVQDVYYQINSQNIITEISPSIFRMSGYSREELIGKNAELFYFDPDERKKLFDLLATADEVWDYEIKLIPKNGGINFTSINAHKMFDNEGNVIGIEGSMRDISDRKKFENDLIKSKEKAEESDRLKTAFLHNISHEIRTPMNAILGYSALLNEPGVSLQSRLDFIDTIQASSNQLLSIINDLVDISSIEANVIKTQISEVNINTILKSLHNQFLIKAAEKNLSLRYDTDLHDQEAYIQTDNTKFVQILSNLINNALKFTSNGEVAFGYKHTGSEVEFFVSDSGIGIPPELHSRIFDTFYQVDNTLTRQYEGAGLGLSICKAYVGLLGGKIWLESEPGKGSVFYFTLPYKPVEQYLSASRAPLFEKPVFPKPKTILVAEDDENNFKLIATMLTGMNVDIIHAENGEKAVAKCRSSKDIDLVLMDIRMPDMDGYSATKQIRMFLPDLPIIAQTAYATDRTKALENGCTDFLSKPFHRYDLISMIKKHLKMN